MVGFLSWWDGVELWLSGLGFVVQTAVVMPVVLLLAYGLASLLDALLGRESGCSNVSGTVVKAGPADAALTSDPGAGQSHPAGDRQLVTHALTRW